VDWFATLVRISRSRPGRLIRRPRRTPRGELLVILVDTSGSTLRGQGLSAAKGLIEGLSQAVYRCRGRLALIGFSGHGVRILHSPSRTGKNPGKLLSSLKGGGGTPIRRALEETVRLLDRERRSHPGEYQKLLILTDGRSRDDLAGIGPIPDCTVVDMESGPVRMARCRKMAHELGAGYVHIGELPLAR